MKWIFLIGILVNNLAMHAQSLSNSLQTAVQKMQADASLEHALIGLYVANSSTGTTIFDYNAQTGMTPASTQKIITSASAFEMLGADFRYQTKIGVAESTSGKLIVVNASGDPSLGSWRWETTNSKNVMEAITTSIKAKGINKLIDQVLFVQNNWETQATPRGWTWEDMGNYYGAGARAFNWNENQYNLTLQPGKKEGEQVSILKMTPASGNSFSLINELKTGAIGSGDQSIIYAAEGSNVGHIRGTVPSGNATFTVKGSMPNPQAFFTSTLKDALKEKGITLLESNEIKSSEKIPIVNPLTAITSPTLDSLNHWFMRESINLYGEAFVKTIALKQKNIAATDTGLAIIRYFWSTHDIDKSALHILDGSGLSPANKVTPAAMVAVLQYALQRPWYNQFYNALPTMNGIKMKSGYISGVRSYAGYVKSSSGTTYSFAFIVNNFDGNAGAVRDKMYKILDLLK
jgi:D-alanyl-D-alanine carboxypeptidase/D-alanyl-D-alanine-endopeptidase (penicillin-binding protein 4)